MPTWLNDAVFYEIYPQSFYDTNADGIGDINGITEKLGYISSLGCNAVWINPCFDSPFFDAGYDVRNYRQVAPRYGTNEDLAYCLQTAHSLGIKVILDLVPGHTSYQHPWFQKSSLAEKNEYSNRYIWTDSVWKVPEKFHFVSGAAERDGNYIVNFFSTQPALNYGFYKITEDWQLPYTHPDCIATREAMKNIMRFWLDMGCDGFRVDMAESLVKNDEEKIGTSEIWRDIRRMLDSEYPQAALISEWSCPQKSLKCGFHCDFYLNQPGNGYHSLFRNKDEKRGEDKSFFSKQGKGDICSFLSDYLDDYEKTKKDGYISFITGNHDTTRMSRNFDALELKIAYAFLLTMPGVPFLYYGDEIGMKFLEGLKSKEGGYTRTGTRTPMQWSHEKNLGFSNAETEELYLPVDSDDNAPTVAAQLVDKNSILNEVKSLIKLRHENADLHGDGEFEVLFAEKNRYPFLYQRGTFVIAVNPSQNAALAPITAEGQVVFSIGHTPRLQNGQITMYPQSFAVMKQ